MDLDLTVDLSTLSDDDLATHLAAARAEFADLSEVADADLTDEQVDRLEALSAFVTATMSTQTERVEASTARADRIAAARTALPEPVVAAEPEPVVAATPPARRSAVTAAAAAAPEATPPAVAALVSLTAAADVSGFAAGQTLTDLDQVVEAALARFGSLPSHSGTRTFQRFGIASIRRQRDEALTQGHFDDDMALLLSASNEARLSGGSLTAAGGWCAPSETMYGLETTATTDGLIDLPEIQVNRGGIRFTKGPDFATLYAGVGWDLTEAEVIAATPKTIFDVACPAFTDVRLDAVGVGIRAGILTQSAYPELVRWYIENSLIAQQHKVSAKMIAEMVTVAGAATSVTNPWPSATASLLAALEIAGEGERQAYRMARNATLEVILPFWVKAAIRADLSIRNGVDLVNVDDAMIERFFTVRKMRVQFVYGWQPMTGTPSIAFPATVEALIYPAGSFVKGTKDVITLDAVYDSTGLVINTYTALFAEEGVLLANVKHTPRRISVAFAVTGLTAGAMIEQAFGGAPGAPIA